MGEVVIDVRRVRKEFGHRRTKVVAVRDVSLRVGRGEVVLILGPSGSGKTTLLSMMGCILTPTSGEICINGLSVTGMPGEALSTIRKRHIGFVFQSFNLLRSLTARENVEVALNLRGVKGVAARRAAGEVLAEVGLAERLDFLPVDLSGGEKQRVSIARAIVNQPGLILADEPTGNLDARTGQTIGQMLHDLAREHRAAVVIVTHDQRIERFADRLLFLEDGMIQSERTMVVT